jgi:tetrapyrrole methylase family protein / MazG family protein
MTLTIVGLGPGNIEDLTLKAWRTLESADIVYLRTERHPCVAHLPQTTLYKSFDDLYEQHDDFAEVYAAISDKLLSMATGADVVYAVPGDPLVGEATTTHLLQAAESAHISVQIVNGISFIEPMLKALGIDALDGLQILDGLTVAAMHHPPLNPSFPAFVAQVYSRQVASDVKLTLMNQYPDDFPVQLIHSAGAETTETQIEAVPLYEIDRSERINHLTSLYVPALGEYSSFEAFQEIIAHLRAPEGCPWDRKQTHESLRPYLIEEAFEVIEAIDAGDWDELAGELGDLLLQIVLHTQIAIDDGEFYMSDVLERVNRKMIRRHPHVWGNVDVDGSSEQVKQNWEQIKQAERAEQGKVRESMLDGIPKAAPALLVAYKYTQKAAQAGFDWPDISDVEAKVREELDEILQAADNTEKAHEIADLMFVLVNWLRWLGVDDVEALMRGANEKFYQRFTYIERQAAAQSRTLDAMTLDEMDALWNVAKANGL